MAENPEEIRIATQRDAAVVAQHRASMFRDLWSLSDEETDEIICATESWIRAQLESGEYVGWFVESGGEVVGGAGVHISPVGPCPGCPKAGRCGHIDNVYTVPSHRRRHIALRIMLEVLRWCAEQRLDRVTLESSADARALYEGLEFIPSGGMCLPKGRLAQHRSHS